jgi:hypothetical protein
MLSPEGWLRQRDKVRRLARRTRDYRRETREIRRRTRAWFSRIGGPEVLAWSIAVGLVWASGRGQTLRLVAKERTLMRHANGLLLAWEFVHRVRSTGAALGLGRGPLRRAPPVAVPPAEQGQHV